MDDCDSNTDNIFCLVHNLELSADSVVQKIHHLNKAYLFGLFDGGNIAMILPCAIRNQQKSVLTIKGTDAYLVSLCCEVRS